MHSVNPRTEGLTLHSLPYFLLQHLRASIPHGERYRQAWKEVMHEIELQQSLEQSLHLSRKGTAMRVYFPAQKELTQHLLCAPATLRPS